jgi:multicomponent Na+:H+ antiporter subunit C
MLTAIVVGVATLGVAFTLLIAIYNRYGTLDEQELLEKIQ